MRVGNLFNLAEKQLQKEKRDGIIPCYTALDIIEYAIMFRKWLDKNKIPKLTKVEYKRNQKFAFKRHNLKGVKNETKKSRQK